MGHDHQQSSSSGAVVAIVGVVLIVAILGVLVVAGAGLFFVQTSRVQVQRAMVAEERAVAEVQRAAAQVQQSSVGAIPAPRLNFDVTLDRAGNASIDGEDIDLDQLRERLAKIKDETSNAFSVNINVDPECPVKHVILVADMLKEVGDVDYRIKSSKNSDVPPDESNPEN